MKGETDLKGMIDKQGDQKFWNKNHPIFFEKVAQKVSKPPKISNKAQTESPKYLHQTTFETLKYLQQTMFRMCLFR
jgi:hypothetical protein